MTRTATRDELIQAGAEIIGLHGFGSTGINTVLSTAGVPKGSFYYYFSSKEDFGLAIIEYSAQEHEAKLNKFLKDMKYPPLERIRNYMNSVMAGIGAGECKRGCLIGNLGQELSSHNETFRARLDEVFRGWQAQFRACLDEAKAAGELEADADTDELAGYLLSSWEGAILRAKIQQSVAPMQTFINVFFSKVTRAAA